MKKDLTELVCILDKSGSMSYVINDTIGGFNSFIKDQKQEPGEANVTLVLFDNHYEVVYDRVNLKDITDLTTKQYTIGGSTALLDAMGKTINSIGAKLASLPEEERPEKVIFLIITDGEENCSIEFKKEQIKEMVDHQTNVYKWGFVFLSSDLNSVKDASSYGMYAANTVMMDKGSRGISGAYNTMSSATKRYRSEAKSQINLQGLVTSEDLNENTNHVL